MNSQSEASGHFSSQNCVPGTGYTPYTNAVYHYPYSRQKKVTITKEYDDQGRCTKEIRTEEWEPAYYQPWWGTGITYNSANTTGTTFKKA